jgi:hypothetical protein
LHPGDFVFVECRDSPKILHITSYGTPEWIEHPFATGNGANFAYALLKKYHGAALDLDKASVLAFKVIEEAIDVGAYGLGPPIYVWHVRCDGIRELDEAAIAALDDAAKTLRDAEVQLLLLSGTLTCALTFIKASCVAQQRRTLRAMQTFLLAGFPRSGLYWLSQFLTVPHRSVCLCDGFEQMAGIEGFWATGEEVCKDKGVEFFGNAATMNLVLLPALLARRPLTKVIWVERRLGDSIRSAEASGFHLGIRSWQGLGQLRIRYTEHFDAEINFNDLSDESAIRAIWAEVLPTVPWNQERWHAFRRKRIVCNRPKLPGQDYSRLERLLRDEAEEIVVPPLL